MRGHYNDRAPRPQPGPAGRFPSTFCLGVGLLAVWVSETGASGASRQPLPDPVTDPHSAEICMNSRVSYHGGWSATATEQMLADVLHATARAPVTGVPLVIYVATPENVYVYDAGSHSLAVHKTGDWRSDGSAAFEVGVSAENMLDAGAAMHLAQLESIALWTGTSNQLASCPRASATTYANGNWSPDDPINIVISFGSRNVSGFTDALVAISSDGSLPSPDTDGPIFLDSVLVDLSYGPAFGAEDLSADALSQILWGAYGCSDHRVSGSKAGLVCASAVANYYLTRRIYSVGPGGVHRYHNRLPPGGDHTTRDHRIEMVTAGDVRPTLRSAIPRLPDAPHYLIICVGAAGSWPELEVGFAAMGALIEASAIDLQGYLTADLSPEEQAAAREATGIPAGDLPMVVVSLGPPSGATDVEAADGPGVGLGLSVEIESPSSGRVTIHYRIPVDDAVELVIYDCLGREVRTLAEEEQEKGPHTALWDCRDERGRSVRSGVYFCRLKAGSLTKGSRVVVVQ
jgi:hypothetical protein